MEKVFEKGKEWQFRIWIFPLLICNSHLHKYVALEKCSISQILNEVWRFPSDMWWELKEMKRVSVKMHSIIQNDKEPRILSS